MTPTSVRVRLRFQVHTGAEDASKLNVGFYGREPSTIHPAKLNVGLIRRIGNLIRPERCSRDSGWYQS